MYEWEDNDDWPPKSPSPPWWILVPAVTLFFVGWIWAIYAKARRYNDSAWDAVMSLMVIFTVAGVLLVAQPFVRKRRRRFERWRAEDPPTG
jgi:4-amino-4-deoxy-L-arabinose transferase-like glycosyltransferase